MPFIPNTDKDRQEMLQRIGVSSFEELLENIPKEIRFDKKLEVGPQLSEFEVMKLMEEYASKNISAATHVCFMGGGAYDHYIPAMVSTVIDRPEFRTAYTPYQAEVSQGTLQSMYEFQSMICGLTGMEVANATLYDGGTALSEACLMAHGINRKSEFLIAGKLNPHYRRVLETICSGRDMSFKEFANEDGSADIEGLRGGFSSQTAGVITQQPNAYGFIEDVHEISNIAHDNGALFIVSVDPVSLAVLQEPAAYGADIVTGEGQPLGIPMSLGGPYIGLFATKQKYIRKIPGRIAGITKDSDGNRSYVLTLQTREQQIKREKATSNICTNQGLFMLAATVYMALMGEQGLREVAELSMQNAHYFADKVKQLPGYSLISDKPFFREFLLQTPVKAQKILEEAEKEGILGGVDSSRFPNCKEGILVAFTEKRTKEEMDRYLEILKRFAK